MGIIGKLFGKPETEGGQIKKKKKYRFRNRQYFADKPLEDLKGIILLTAPGEAERVAGSKVFIGTVQDTVGAWMNEVERPIIAIGHPKTKVLFDRAAAGTPMVESEIIIAGVGASLQQTKNRFPPGPVTEHTYIIRAMPENEITRNCFVSLFAY